MWLQYYQPLIADLVQKALIRLCQDHIPHTDKLEIDGIVCISCGTVEKQIVVKVHDVIGTERSDPQLKAHILQVPGFKRKLTNRDNGDDDGTMPKLSRAEATVASAPVDLSTHEAPSDVNTDDSDSGRESPDDKPAQKSDNAQPRLQRGVSLLKLLSESPSFNPVTATINRDDNDSCSSSESNICHKRDAEIRCRVCGDEFKTVQALQLHVSSVHKRYLCKHCFNTFSLRCNLNRHERLHTGVKPFPCSHCNRSFARNADLRLHMQKHESENQPDSSICQFCKKEFSQRQELLFHLFKIHKVQDGIFACTICEQVFEDEEKYNEHWDSHTASLQQHGKIDVSPRLTINKIPPPLTPVENPAGDQSKKTPPVLWREKPYKSLLPPKLKPLFVNVNKDAVQVCQGDGSSSESPIPMHDAVDDGVSDKVTCGVDLDSIKREFGPLFHYNEESIVDTGEHQDDCCANDSPESCVKQESEDSAKIYSVVEPIVKSKRKNRPQRVVSGNHDEGSPSTGRKSSAVKTESVSILNKSTSLLSGSSVTEKKSESIKTNLQTTPKKEKREVVLAEILEESSLSPSPNIKDVERDGHCSPSLDALADDESSYECRYGGCGMQLHSFKAYEDHFYISHGRYPCKICEQSFTCKNNRTRHVRNHLGLAKKHGCEYCNKVFSRPDTLQEHKFIHTKSYQQDQCNGCGATFDRKAVLLSHIKKCLKSRANLLEEDLKNDSTQENGEVN